MDEKQKMQVESQKDHWNKFLETLPDMKYWRIITVSLFKKPSPENMRSIMVRGRNEEEAITKAKSGNLLRFDYSIIKIEEVKATEYLLAVVADIENRTHHIDDTYGMVACLFFLTIISIIISFFILR